MPPAWEKGSYSGLVARGNFVINCKWENARLTTMTITARVGGECQVRYPDITNAKVTNTNGNAVATTLVGNDLAIQTVASGTYQLSLL